jgi:site-specific DNA recombinase
VRIGSAPYTPVTFDAAQELLDQRGEDCSKRGTNSTDYLLTGIVSCARCGNHYVGASAHGRSARDRYYICFSRQRYGDHGCQAERLPADELDQAILEAMLATYADRPRVSQAIHEACRRAEDGVPQLRHEMLAVEAEIAKTRRALERYFSAFEDGTLSSKRLAHRVEGLEQRMNELHGRKGHAARGDRGPGLCGAVRGGPGRYRRGDQGGFRARDSGPAQSPHSDAGRRGHGPEP